MALELAMNRMDERDYAALKEGKATLENLGSKDIQLALPKESRMVTLPARYLSLSWQEMISQNMDEGLATMQNYAKEFLIHEFTENKIRGLEYDLERAHKRLVILSENAPKNLGANRFDFVSIFGGMNEDLTSYDGKFRVNYYIFKEVSKTPLLGKTQNENLVSV